MKDSFETLDHEHKTIDVTIVGVHIDAVLEIPYYTILLPNGHKKMTDMERLLPFSNTTSSSNGNREGRSHSSNSSSHHHRSRSRSSSRPRSHGEPEERERSTSRRRSSSRMDDDAASVKSDKSYASRQRSSSTNMGSRHESSSKRTSSRPRASSRGRNEHSSSITRSSVPNDGDANERRSSSHRSRSNSFRDNTSNVKLEPTKKTSQCRLVSESRRSCKDKDESCQKSDEHRPRVDSMRGGWNSVSSKTFDPLQERNDASNDEASQCISLKSKDHSSFASDAAAAVMQLRALSKNATTKDDNGKVVSTEPPSAITLSQRKRDTTSVAKEVCIQSKPCDKCDGSHPSCKCPVYSKRRELHKDAWSSYGSDAATTHHQQQQQTKVMGNDGRNFVLPQKNAKVVTMPGDGSCLFHSLVYCINSMKGTSFDAKRLRKKIASHIAANPNLFIADDKMKQWVKWDSGKTVQEYASEMAVSGWGGGVEIVACTHLFNVNIHVYESQTTSSPLSADVVRNGHDGYLRISCFNAPTATYTTDAKANKTLHLLYQGRKHYDALLVSSD